MELERAELELEEAEQGTQLLRSAMPLPPDYQAPPPDAVAIKSKVVKDNIDSQVPETEEDKKRNAEKAERDAGEYRRRQYVPPSKEEVALHGEIARMQAEQMRVLQERAKREEA